MNNKFYTYRHIRLDTNEVFYIGKGCRFRAWETTNRSKFWRNIVSKIENKYKIEIVTKNLIEIDAHLHEKHLIDIYGRKDLGLGTLCNLTDGGEGVSGKRSTKFKRKSLSLERKAFISKLHSGIKKGSFSLEHRDKLSKSRKGKRFTENHAINIGVGHQKKIINNETGIIYNSLKEVKSKCNISSGHLSKILKGEHPKLSTFSYFKTS